MAKITYVEFNGRETTVDVPDGWSLMQAAVTNNIQGIVAECGGSMACATCHCYVDEARLGDLPPPEEGELAHARHGGGRSAAEQPPLLPDQGLARPRRTRRPPARNQG